MDSVDQQQRALAAAPGQWGMWFPLGAMAALAVVTVGVPGARAVLDAASAPAAESAFVPTTAAGMAAMLLRTAVYAAGIGVLATALAWPAAWTLRSSRSARVIALWGAFIAVPLLLPNYLAYAGLNLLRAPRTPLGDWIATWPTAWQLVVPRVFAVVGLALWAWPLAAIVLAPAVRRVPRGVLEMLELDGAGRLWPVRRTLLLARMLRGPLMLSAGAVTVVMLGSAVPLHVAQVETYAANLWLLLNMADPAGVWRSAWPLLLAVVAAGAAAGARLLSGATGAWEGEEGATGGGVGAGRGNAWMAGGVWGLSVLLPTALFIVNLRTPGEAFRIATALEMCAAFWRMSGEAVAAGLATSAGTGVMTGAVAMSAWAVFSLPRGGGTGARAVRGGAMVVAGAWLLAALIPGVLVGTATARAWSLLPLGREVADSPAILVLAHTARFAVIGVLAGAWLAALEPRAEREARALDGATGVGGWWIARVRHGRGFGAVVGVGLAAAALSFHEIEAAVIVQPPGAPSLPQQILEHLHFARDERLAAAAVNLIGLGILAAGVSGWLIGRAGERG